MQGCYQVYLWKRRKWPGIAVNKEKKRMYNVFFSLVSCKIFYWFLFFEKYFIFFGKKL